MKQTFINKIQKRTIREYMRALEYLYEFNSPYQLQRMARQFFDLAGKNTRTVISKSTKDKSQNALGMYYGAIVPACIMDYRELKYIPEQIYDDFKRYCQFGVIKDKDEAIDAMDNSLRKEFFYGLTVDLPTGDIQRYPKSLKEADSEALEQLIERVMDWRNEQGYPFIDVEAYKELKDSAQLVDETS